MAKFITFAGNLLELAGDVDLMKAITALSSGWNNLSLGDGSSLASILAAGTAALRDPRIKTAATGAGLAAEYDMVIDAIDRLASLADSDRARAVLRLLSRVDRFADDGSPGSASDPGLVRWQPLSVAVDGGGAPLSFEVGVNAAIEIEAGDRWPYRNDYATDGGLDGLLRVQIDGDASAAIDATLPLKFGSIGLGAQAKAAANLAWYVTPASPAQIFVDAVASAIPQLPLPTRFETLWRAFQTSNLKGLVLAIDGEIGLSAEIALAATGSIAGVGGIGAGLTVKAKIMRAARYQLSARAVGTPGGAMPHPIVVAVTNAKSRQSTLGADFSVKLDATDLREKTASIVRNVIEEWDDALKPIEKYLSPGTFLRDELASQLDNAVDTITGDGGLKAALKVEARRGLGLDPSDTDLKTWVRDTIIDAVSSEADKVHAGANAAIAKVVARIPVAGIADGAAALLKTEIGKLLTAFDAGLKTAVTAIAAASGAGLAAMLARIGVTVNGAVNTLDGQLAAVRQLLQQFNALLAKIAAATQMAANFRLQIVFATETVTRAWSEFMFCGTFSADTPATRKLFEQLVAGHIDRVAEMLGGGNTVPDVVIDASRSFALRGKSWQQSTDFGLFILGIEISSKLLLTAAAEVRTTAEGIVVTGAAGASVIDSRPDGTQIVKFTSPYALAVETGSNPRRLTMGLAIDLNRFEKDLQEHELVTFLSDLERTGLLPGSVLVQAQQLLARWQPIGGVNKKVPGRIEVGFMLDAAAVERLYQRSERKNRRLPLGEEVKIVRIMVDSLLRSQAISAKDLAVGLSFALAAISGEPETGNAENILYLARYDRDWAPLNISSGLDQSRFERFIDQFGGTNLLGHREDGRMLPFLSALDALADLALASTGSPDHWREGDFLAALRRVAEGIAPWLGRNKTIFKLDDRVFPQLIALILLVRSLAQVPTGLAPGGATGAGSLAPLYLVMSRGPKGDEDRTVIV